MDSDFTFYVGVAGELCKIKRGFIFVSFLIEKHAKSLSGQLQREHFCVSLMTADWLVVEYVWTVTVHTGLELSFFMSVSFSGERDLARELTTNITHSVSEATVSCCVPYQLTMR